MSNLGYGPALEQWGIPFGAVPKPVVTKQASSYYGPTTPACKHAQTSEYSWFSGRDNQAYQLCNCIADATERDVCENAAAASAQAKGWLLTFALVGGGGYAGYRAADSWKGTATGAALGAAFLCRPWRSGSGGGFISYRAGAVISAIVTWLAVATVKGGMVVTKKVMS